MSLRFETGRAHRPPGRPGGRVVLGVALLLLGAAQAAGVVRYEATYTVKWGGHAGHVAARVAPQTAGTDRWLVAQEICALNGLPSATYRLSVGDKLRVPVYERRTRAPYAIHPYRRWHCAVMSALRYLVSPRLLYAVASHENPLNDADACGCKGYSGLRDEFASCARTCRHFIGDAALSPTLADVRRLGAWYAEDPGWARKVWAKYGALRP